MPVLPDEANMILCIDCYDIHPIGILEHIKMVRSLSQTMLRSHRPEATPTDRGR